MLINWKHQMTLPSCSSDQQYSSSGSKGVSLSRQSSIIESFSTIRSFSDGGGKAGKITNAIIFMIAKDNLPLNTVQKEGFKYFMKTPQTFIPCTRSQNTI
ncbi:unnamed protein product [Acanthoscelides obtectus]|uniref:Uncharacterized protein n=1 Tax=Acanthoscelides obtectus TaxID=200917 RepID=A0A9P0M9N7_ACAOB|nr:unnamed protein product [Acanthoscelides obtectus]CAK1650420.1 hypothetical protein AOBTE_LOCUS16769 [Acanthoscelides obtectus]